MNKYETQIEKAISEYENYPYRTHSMDWIINRIDWCWKWRKISTQKKDEFCNRVITILENGVDII